ncbi:MAG: hypothetical protein AAGD09_24120 [Cyanobacteria bacterium P01_F01_bin.56]
MANNSLFQPEDQTPRRKGVARVRATDAGLQQINQARKRKGWSKYCRAWYELAFTSQSTLKRFWRKNRIGVDYFVSICSAVGIDEWESIADWTE